MSGLTRWFWEAGAGIGLALYLGFRNPALIFGCILACHVAFLGFLILLYEFSDFMCSYLDGSEPHSKREILKSAPYSLVSLAVGIGVYLLFYDTMNLLALLVCLAAGYLLTMGSISFLLRAAKWTLGEEEPAS
jgi:hypothetical protein